MNNQYSDRNNWWYLMIWKTALFNKKKIISLNFLENSGFCDFADH